MISKQPTPLSNEILFLSYFPNHHQHSWHSTVHEGFPWYVNPNGNTAKTISAQRMYDYCSSCFTSRERGWRRGVRPKESANQLKVRQHHRRGKKRDTSIFHRPWAGQSVSKTFFISFLHLYYNSGPTIWLHVTRSILINAKRLSFDLLGVLSCVSVLSPTGGLIILIPESNRDLQLPCIIGNKLLTVSLHPDKQLEWEPTKAAFVR